MTQKMQHNFTGFYVATDFARKEDAAAVADGLELAGLRLTARWIRTQPVTKEGGLGGELDAIEGAVAERIALEDFEDIMKGQLFVQLTSGEKARGGRHVELGYALALTEFNPHREVVVIGPREHAFHYHPHVTHLEDLSTLREWVVGYKERHGIK